jgi:hypothetical protein
MEGDSKAQASTTARDRRPGHRPGLDVVDEVRQRKNLEPKGGKSAEIFNPNDAPAKPAKEPTP